MIHSIKIAVSICFALSAALVLTRANAQADEWTWVGGSDTVNQLGVYGTLGVAASTNAPGGRVGAASCTDAKDSLWLFGGSGYGSNAGQGSLNDLWKFSSSTREWTWAAGSNTLNQTGVYGAIGIEGTANAPGSRELAICWTDVSGNLWLFGGAGKDSNGGYGALNDLWKFDLSTGEWVWMGGSKTAGQPGAYGILGQAAKGNNPGSRYNSASWTDANHNLWLFGGQGYDSKGTGQGILNDLWQFNASTLEWTWVAGSDSAYQPAVYGTVGVADAANIPGSLYLATSWMDAQGNFWLFGGNGNDSTGNQGILNDLWEFNPSTKEWTWQAGTTLVDPSFGVVGVYGTLGVPAATNAPGSRFSAPGWTDKSGNLWLFGGNGFDSNDGEGNLNDLWVFNPYIREWAWMGGSKIAGQVGVNGTLGVPAAANTPSSRQLSNGWTDSNGNLWLFGGYGDFSATNYGYLSDLWMYQPSAPISSTATPTFSPASGTYSTAQTVTLLDSVAGASIYYTNDGTTPTTSSTKYSVALKVSATQTIKAIATSTGLANSPVVTATYTLQAKTPRFSLGSGTYNAAQTVTISDATPGSTIYYTTDGTSPTANSTKYIGGITVSKSEAIMAIATFAGYAQSAVAKATYTLQAATPAFSLAAGTYYSAQPLQITDASSASVIYYTTNGTTPTASSTPYTSSISISNGETVKAVALVSGFLDSKVFSATYTLQVSMPSLSVAPGTYTSVQSVSLSDTTPGATIYYTTNGTVPTTNSTKYTAAITIAATETLSAIAVAAGYLNSGIVSAAYTINLIAATPTFSLMQGVYPDAQMLTLSTSTPNATIYFTTNGTTPTTNSTKYTVPVVIGKSETIEAIAAVTGYTPSPVSSATYTLAGSPHVITGLATSVTTSSATLNATFDDFGLAGQIWFVWGISSASLNSSTSKSTISSSTSFQNVGLGLTGLASRSTYYFQPVVATAGGTTYGAIQTFTTN